jgi:serine/threonine-protein kinase RsbW
MCNSPISTLPISQQLAVREEGNNQEGGDRRAPEFWVHLTVPSRVQAINPTVNKLKKMLKAACLERSQAFAIETALREVLANAIVHGNRLNRAKSVRVGCGCSGREIRIVIADEGDGFDPGALESPLAAKNLDSDHGRGILLIRSLMGDVRFEKGGREIHMCKNRVRKSESKGQHG